MIFYKAFLCILGSLYDAVGFRWSTLFTVGWNVLVGVAALILIVVKNRNRNERIDYEEIVGVDDMEDSGDIKPFGETQINLHFSRTYQSI